MLWLGQAGFSITETCVCGIPLVWSYKGDGAYKLIVLFIWTLFPSEPARLIVRYLLALCVIVSTCPAFGQGLPNSLNMTCASASGLVKQNGAVVIATGPNVYARYVANLGYCQHDQMTRPAWIQTSDNPQCYIGSQCVQRMNNH